MLTVIRPTLPGAVAAQGVHPQHCLAMDHAKALVQWGRYPD